MRKVDDSLIGESPAFLEVVEAVSRAAPLNRPVLVIGERGTGKELVAARVHYLSPRWDQPYVKLNCAALTESLLESELFGHEAGSFTGATRQRKGRFELADGGTLFLDELACTPPSVQEKILRVIEYGEFERVGGTRPVRVDVRIVAAANEDLPSLVEQGEFRADLLDRLAFDVITIPPLRQRRDDILTLAEHFGRRMTSELAREVFAGFSERASNKLLDHDWPGNIRELKNVVERAVYRAGEEEEPVDEIILDPFASPWRPQPVSGRRRASTSDDADRGARNRIGGPVNFKETVKDFEVELIEQAMEVCKYNQRKAADYLGLTYHQLRGYLRKYELLESSSNEETAEAQRA